MDQLHETIAVEQFLEMQRELINDQGFVINAVSSDDDVFYYTAGLTEKGLPELLLTGAPIFIGPRLLSAIVRLWNGGDAEIRDGEFKFEIIPIAKTEKLLHNYVCIANRLYPDAKYAQALWPDENSNMPYQDGYDHKSRPQKMMEFLQ